MGLQILETSKHSIRITCDRIDGVANLNWESQQKKGVIDEADSRSSLKRLKKRRSNHNRLALSCRFRECSVSSFPVGSLFLADVDFCSCKSYFMRMKK